MGERRALTERAVALTFAVPLELRADFDFVPGQHLTLRAVLDGEEVRQSYSICQTRGPLLREGRLRVAAARVEGGRMSTWLTTAVRPGDEVDVLTPLGSFTCRTRPDTARHHLAVAAGSGITPVLSVVTSVLEDEPRSRVTLLYGNRSVGTTMFGEELSDLEKAHPERFRLVHVLSREGPEGPLRGRLDRRLLGTLLDGLPAQPPVDAWYLCGPAGLVTGAQALLLARGVPDSRVHHEVFHVPSDPS